MNRVFSSAAMNLLSVLLLASTVLPALAQRPGMQRVADRSALAAALRHEIGHRRVRRLCSAVADVSSSVAVLASAGESQQCEPSWRKPSDSNRVR